MANMIEIRERQKYLLQVLLEIKAANRDIQVAGLQDAIKRAVVVMEHEDVAWVEKILKVTALDD